MWNWKFLLLIIPKYLYWGYSKLNGFPYFLCIKYNFFCFKILFILCANVFTCVNLCVLCACMSPRRPEEEGIGFLGAGVRGSCKWLCGCWELNLGPMQKQEIPLSHLSSPTTYFVILTMYSATLLNWYVSRNSAPSGIFCIFGHVVRQQFYRLESIWECLREGNKSGHPCSLPKRKIFIIEYNLMLVLHTWLTDSGSHLLTLIFFYERRLGFVKCLCRYMLRIKISVCACVCWGLKPGSQANQISWKFSV